MKKNYSTHFKLKVIREKEQGYSYPFLAKKYGLKHSTLKNWWSQYQMFGEAGIEKSLSKTNYSGEFKLSVLNYRHIQKVSYRETAEHFGIKNSSTIANWQRSYDTKGLAGLERSIGRPQKRGTHAMSNKEEKPRDLTPSELEELLELREKTQYLEAELAYLKKLDALIRKKSHTKKKPK